MSWTKLISKTGTIMLIVSALFVSTSVSANSQPAAESELPKESALALVEEYRELRRSCAYMEGDARKACYHELHANNGDYRLAKQQLEQKNNNDPNNVHLVTF